MAASSSSAAPLSSTRSQLVQLQKASTSSVGRVYIDDLSEDVIYISNQLSIAEEDVWRLYTAVDSQHKGWIKKQKLEPGSINGVITAWAYMLRTYDTPISVDRMLDLHRVVLTNVDMRRSGVWPRVYKGKIQTGQVGGCYARLSPKMLEKVAGEHVGSPIWCQTVLGLASKTTRFVNKVRYDSQGNNYFIEVEDDINLIKDTLEQALTNYRVKINQPCTRVDKLTAIAQLVKEGNLIHALPDANGRTWTLLLNQLLIANGFSPCLLVSPRIFRGHTLEEIVDAIELGMVNFRKLQQNKLGRLTVRDIINAIGQSIISLIKLQRQNLMLPSVEEIVYNTTVEDKPALLTWAASTISPLHYQVLNYYIARFGVNDCGENGNTALIYAVFNQDVKSVELLLAQIDIDVNKAGQGGLTALDWAIQRQNPDIIALLTKKGALATGKTTPCLLGTLANREKIRLLFKEVVYYSQQPHLADPLQIAVLYMGLRIIGNNFCGWQQIYERCCDQLILLEDEAKYDLTTINRYWKGLRKINQSLDKIDDVPKSVVRIFTLLSLHGELCKPSLTVDKKLMVIKGFYDLDDNAVIKKIISTPWLKYHFPINKDLYQYLLNKFSHDLDSFEESMIGMASVSFALTLFKDKAFQFLPNKLFIQLLEKSLNLIIKSPDNALKIEEFVGLFIENVDDMCDAAQRLVVRYCYQTKQLGTILFHSFIEGDKYLLSTFLNYLSSDLHFDFIIELIGYAISTGLEPPMVYQLVGSISANIGRFSRENQIAILHLLSQHENLKGYYYQYFTEGDKGNLSEFLGNLSVDLCINFIKELISYAESAEIESKSAQQLVGNICAYYGKFDREHQTAIFELFGRHEDFNGYYYHHFVGISKVSLCVFLRSLDTESRLFFVRGLIDYTAENELELTVICKLVKNICWNLREFDSEKQEVILQLLTEHPVLKMVYYFDNLEQLSSEELQSKFVIAATMIEDTKAGSKEEKDIVNNSNLDSTRLSSCDSTLFEKCAYSEQSSSHSLSVRRGLVENQCQSFLLPEFGPAEGGGASSSSPGGRCD